MREFTWAGESAEVVVFPEHDLSAPLMFALSSLLMFVLVRIVARQRGRGRRAAIGIGLAVTLVVVGASVACGVAQDERPAVEFDAVKSLLVLGPCLLLASLTAFGMVAVRRPLPGLFVGLGIFLSAFGMAVAVFGTPGGEAHVRPANAVRATIHDDASGGATLRLDRERRAGWSALGAGVAAYCLGMPLIVGGGRVSLRDRRHSSTA